MQIKSVILGYRGWKNWIPWGQKKFENHQLAAVTTVCALNSSLLPRKDPHFTTQSFFSILCRKRFAPGPHQRCTVVISLWANHQGQMGFWIPHCVCYWVVNFILHWAVEAPCFSGLTSCPTLNPVLGYGKYGMGYLAYFLEKSSKYIHVKKGKCNLEQKQCTDRAVSMFLLSSPWK